MRQSTRVRTTVMATVVGAAAAMTPLLPARAEDKPLDPKIRSSHDQGHMRSFTAEEGGVPPRALRLRAIVSRAWEDSVSTWQGLMQSRASDIGQVNLRFVRRLEPTNCYGLYTGEGPAYCSGNNTIFVGTDAAHRLMARFGPQAETGITYIIGHEMGHHIQNMFGRFHVLNNVIARIPASRVEVTRRFELEADCYAGVWIQHSRAWTNSGRFRADMDAVLRSIGDEALLSDESKEAVVKRGVHGTSQQRTRWFKRGFESGDWRACDAFATAEP